MDKIAAQRGSSSTDSGWDAFLRHSPYGHFEQCSGWAAAKAVEGWKCSRIELLEKGRLAGCFQILHRNQGRFPIGYISKGPIIDPENPAVAEFAIESIKSEAQQLKICALLVQPPQQGQSVSPALMRHGFLPNHLHHMIEATLLVDTSCDHTDLLQRLRRTTRQSIRQSEGHGTLVREGSERDLPVFFELMTATCRRQKNVKPNPASLASLQAIWQSLYKTGNLRLTIAEIGGNPVSGLLSVVFGDRVTFWKKGWNSEYGDRHPNELLFYESLEWSRKHGYKICDFAAVAPDLARTLLQRKPLTEKQKGSRDLFNLGFGGYPVLLPASCVWLPNPILRKCYGVFCSLKSRH